MPQLRSDKQASDDVKPKIELPAQAKRTSVPMKPTNVLSAANNGQTKDTLKPNNGLSAINNGRSSDVLKPKAQVTAKSNGRAKPLLKPKGTVPAANNGQARKSLKPIKQVPVPKQAGGYSIETERDSAGIDNKLARPALKSKAAVPTSSDDRRLTKAVQSSESLTAIVEELQTLQRNLTVVVKNKNMFLNRLRALVAPMLGYRSGIKDEKERKARFAKADGFIKEIVEGNRTHELGDVIRMMHENISMHEDKQEQLKKALEKSAKQLPVAAWMELPEQQGFGWKSLGAVIGETGDLSNYANPGKVWRRMGCAPWEYDGKVMMGSSWRKAGLPAAEWEDYGYVMRRRSVMYVVGESLLKGNYVTGESGFEIERECAGDEVVGEDDGDEGDTSIESDARCAGPYRLRYLEAKVRAFSTHPEWEWKPCDKCKGEMVLETDTTSACTVCGGTGMKCGHAHKHGMLLMVKLLLKNLWVEWNK